MSPEPTIEAAQLALNEVRKTFKVPFDTVKSVAPMRGLRAGYYELRFWNGPALTIFWDHESESFQQAAFNGIAKYLGSDGTERFADHDA